MPAVSRTATKNAAARDALFRALADPTRRALFERLMAEGELTVRALTDESGVSQPMVSKHLGVLKEAGLVCDRPEGRVVHYRAAPNSLKPLLDWTVQYRAFWNDHLDRLDDLLNRMDQ
jgi:DNA-binding transcriptional ArsR family regulator